MVFFDFDGVVLDSANIKTKAFPLVFSDYPEHIQAITDYHINNQGISRFQKFEWFYNTLLKEELSPERSIELGNKFSSIVLNEVLQASFIKGAETLLKFLKVKGIPCIVASGTPYKELHEIVEQRSLSPYFKEVWGSPKSKKDIVLDCLNRYNIKPEEALFLGDATTDYEAAQATLVNFQAIDSPELKDFWLEQNVTAIDHLEDVIKKYF
jgi:beta-phosphoglucomutase-like phosphatase (HAD superfamily)